MRQDKWLLMAIIVLLVTLIIPRLHAGPVVVVKYDMLRWVSVGDGVAAASEALAAKLVSAVMALSLLVLFVFSLPRRLPWLVLALCSAAAFASISMVSHDDLRRSIPPRGAPLIRGIEAFREQHGQYPAALYQLGEIPA